jgi:hypothetical protein
MCASQAISPTPGVRASHRRWYDHDVLIIPVLLLGLAMVMIDVAAIESNQLNRLQIPFARVLAYAPLICTVPAIALWLALRAALPVRWRIISWLVAIFLPGLICDTMLAHAHGLLTYIPIKEFPDDAQMKQLARMAASPVTATGSYRGYFLVLRKDAAAGASVTLELQHMRLYRPLLPTDPTTP